MKTSQVKTPGANGYWQQNGMEILNALPDAILGISRNGEINFLNRAAEDLFEAGSNKIIPLSFKDLLSAGSDEIWGNCILSLLNSNNAGRLTNTRVELALKKGNGEVWRADVLARVSDLPGTAILLSIRNIDLLHAHSNPLFLQNQIETLEKELAASKAEINSVNQELEAFKFSLAHDLRSPLRIISGYTKIVERKYENRLNDEALELLTSIQSYSKRLNDLMAEMLAFSKLGKTELVLATLDMTSIAQSAINELNSNVKHKAEIKLQALKPSTGDPFMLKQVFYNLLSNAVKYSSKTTNPVVEIGSHYEPERTVYWISDNGIGFDMKYEKMIYNLFYRLHDLKEYEGMGVGLAAAQRIIGRHNGKLWAISKPGEGTTFCFSIPAV